MAAVAAKKGKKGKKGDASPAVIQLGRPGNDVKMGILGLPNVGKSSFFNLLTKMNVPAENFPFCTIDPAESKVPVPDKRWRKLCNDFKPKKEIPAVLTVKDIAGLVEGAAEGKGLGNAFLSHVQATDALYHMVRAFPKASVTHVCESVDPVRDIEIISKEYVTILLRLLRVCNRSHHRSSSLTDILSSQTPNQRPRVP